MKPKDWLLANGHIKEITRGRMSRENIALIQEAVNNGTKIEGYAPNEDGEVERVSTDPNRILDIPEFPMRDEREWQAYAFSDNRHIGMRTVCNNCSSSLTYCGCPHPVVNLDYDTTSVVGFKGRTAPLPTRLW